MNLTKSLLLVCICILSYSLPAQSSKRSYVSKPSFDLSYLKGHATQSKNLATKENEKLLISANRNMATAKVFGVISLTTIILGSAFAYVGVSGNSNPDGPDYLPLGIGVIGIGTGLLSGITALTFLTVADHKYRKVKRLNDQDNQGSLGYNHHPEIKIVDNSVLFSMRF